MARTPKDVTDAEFAVLNLLWERDRWTVRELTNTIYPDGSAAHYATVQKLLDRLEKKKFVKRHRNPPKGGRPGNKDGQPGMKPHEFESLVNRKELIGRRLQATADKLCDGLLAPLLTHLVNVKVPLNPDERSSLRGFLDQLDREAQ